MEQFLIWLNFGGDAEVLDCKQDFYRVCQGDTEEEAVMEWAALNGFDTEEVQYKNRGWTLEGLKVSVFKLATNNGPNGWKRLRWHAH